MSTPDGQCQGIYSGHTFLVGFFLTRSTRQPAVFVLGFLYGLADPYSGQSRLHSSAKCVLCLFKKLTLSCSAHGLPTKSRSSLLNWLGTLDVCTELNEEYK